MRSIRRLGFLVLLLVAPLLAAPTAAAPFPASVPLPDDFQPEGIAIGAGDTFYVGSLWDGDIYRGDLSTGDGAVLIDVAGRQAVGMEVDDGRHLLFVAGGFTGRAWVYDVRDGSTVAELPLGGALVNDVTVTRDAAYFTDTFRPHLYRVPIHRDGSLGAPETILVTGPAGESEPGTFGLNGIKATPSGSVLLVNHTALGILATVDPDTGASALVEGVELTTDTADGLILDGRTAWVVENFANKLVEVTLSPDLSAGEITAELSSPAFRVPTTVDRIGDRLAVVNGRFDLGFPPPIGPGAPAGTDFDVAVVRIP